MRINEKKFFLYGIFFVFSSVILSGCGLAIMDAHRKDKLTNLRKNMSSTQVKKIMGQPSVKSEGVKNGNIRKTVTVLILSGHSHSFCSKPQQ